MDTHNSISESLLDYHLKEINKNELKEYFCELDYTK